MALFTGNVNLLVAAPMLQDYLVDKDGTPMSGGTITCYHDNSRTTLKNWYYQSGTPGNYTYITLPNPLTLSAAGTICDLNGVDTIPFFYPYNELDQNEADPYYITIVNYAQTNQITRSNFPFMAFSGSSGSTVNTFNNLIVNNGFWRNIAPNTLNITPFTSQVLTSAGTTSTLFFDSSLSLYRGIVAPSQHDGFRMPDIEYVVNNLSPSDTATFTPFPLGNSQPISGTLVPEYYVSHNCTNVGSAVTMKCYQFPIALHVNSLANVPFTFSFQAQNGGGTGVGSNVVTIFIFQDTGTGPTPPEPMELTQFALTQSWATYTFSGVFPSTSGLTLGNGADDALYLQIQMPLSTTCTINFTKPSIYLTSGIVPSYDYQSYDRIDSITNSPRTGDLRTSINEYYYFGWVPMNDGTIGNGSSNATARANADTWNLFKLIWSLFSQYSASGSGTSNPVCQMYNSSGVPVGYGSNLSSPTTAIQDFNSNNSLSLTKSMARVFLGTVPIAALLPTFDVSISSVSTASSQLLFTVASTSTFFVGQPVNFISTGTYPGTIVPNSIYFVTNISGNTFQIATSFANAIASIATGGTSTTYTGALVAFLQSTGTTEGEYSHTMQLNEMINHTHNPLSGTGFWMNSTGQASGMNAPSSSGLSQPTTGTITNYVSQTPFNITQPSTSYNVYIKI